MKQQHIFDCISSTHLQQPQGKVWMVLFTKTTAPGCTGDQDGCITDRESNYQTHTPRFQ